MPQNYSGDPANVTTPLVANVNGCAAGAGGVVRVQTSAAHNFATHDYVTVTGVVGTVEANTNAKINVIDGTHFDMIGTVFSNPYVSGGTATDVSLTPYFQIPNDGEQGTVASMNAAIQALADRTQYLQQKGDALGLVQNTVSNTTATVQAPQQATQALVVGWGGGGGGGAGANGSTTPGERNSAGSGGGGAIAMATIVPVVGGQLYDVYCGPGGAGASSPGGNALDGNASTFSQHGGSVLATLAGGGKGHGGATQTGDNGFTVGGICAASSDYSWVGASPKVSALPSGFTYSRGMAEGGIGYTTATVIDVGACRGTGNPLQGAVGGARGTNGADSSGTFYGGGAGGGGGAGPGGPGGAGGGGGNGFNGGVGGGGGPGSAGLANTGAGGGGGGAGGQGSGGGGLGAIGGPGGSGTIAVYWLR
jgi:hypothetical protein